MVQFDWSICRMWGITHWVYLWSAILFIMSGRVNNQLYVSISANFQHVTILKLQISALSQDPV